VIHLINGLSVYTAGAVPRLPLSFDLAATFTEGGWQYTEMFFKQQTIYFSIVGMMYFVQSGRAASLWIAMIALQIVRMILGAWQAEITGPMAADQQGGAIVAMGLVTLFLARRHLWAVAKACVGAPANGRGLPGRWAGWCVVIGVVGQIAWLWAAGASPVGAAMIVLLLLLLLITLARTLAETGIPYLLLPLDFRRVTLYAHWDVPACGGRRPATRSGRDEPRHLHARHARERRRVRQHRHAVRRAKPARPAQRAAAAADRPAGAGAGPGLRRVVGGLPHRRLPLRGNARRRGRGAGQRLGARGRCRRRSRSISSPPGAARRTSRTPASYTWESAARA
jgi:hypothetical protein